MMTLGRLVARGMLIATGGLMPWEPAAAFTPAVTGSAMRADTVSAAMAPAWRWRHVVADSVPRPAAQDSACLGPCRAAAALVPRASVAVPRASVAVPRASVAVPRASVAVPVAGPAGSAGLAPRGAIAAIGADPSWRSRTAAGASTAADATQPPPRDPRTSRTLYGVAHERVRGDLNLTGEAYASVGQPGRRPGSSWRAQVSPRVDLGFGISASAEALLSSEGTQLRQNINQAGFNPEWRWGKLYLGDFSRPLTPYTVQGVRARGAGLDLRFGGWQANVQTGRTQRAVSRPGDQLVFERRLTAGTIEWRRSNGAGIGIAVAHAKDNPNSVERDLLIADSLALDSLVADTLLDPFRPRPQASNRPQENLVSGLVLDLPLFRQALRLKGELAGALLSSDITRPRVADGAGGAAAFVDPLMPLRLSTQGDIAWNAEAQLALGGVSLRGQMERIGPGYTSLGLGYLIADRRSWMLGGVVPFLHNRGNVSLQAQRMADNVLGQKTFTTGRDNYVASVSLRPVDALSLAINGTYNVVGNDAPIDTLRQDVRMQSLNTSLGWSHGAFGRKATTSLAWTYQKTDDAAPRPLAPDVTVQNLTVSEQLPVTDAVSLAPSLSWAVTAPAGGETQRNAFVGFRAQVRGFRDRLNSSATLSRTFTAGRQVTAARLQSTWQLPYEASLLLQGRWNAYSAFGTRPAFSESFVTLAMSRPF